MRDATIEEVRQVWQMRWAEFKPEEQATFRQNFVIHDYEIFPDDILLTVVELRGGVARHLWGADKIRDYLRRSFLRDDSTVLVGYNNKKFDNRITDALLDGADERSLKRLSDALIANDEEEIGWRSGERGRRPAWVGRTFDIGFDLGQKKIGTPPNERKIPEVSLKRWERLNGYRTVRSEVPFDRRDLSKAEREKVEGYCLYDVCATALCFMSKEAWNPCVNSRRVLVDDYGDRGVDWEMTKPRITALVLNAREEHYEVPVDWERERYRAPSCLRIMRHRDVLRAYDGQRYGDLRAMSSRKAGGLGVLTKQICGIPHVYGIGGVHGCPSGIWQSYGGGIWSLDAASLYPNLMRHYNFLSRRVVGQDRDRFGELIDLRVKVYKPKKDRRADGLKLVLNGGFGSMGFEKSEMYDPVNFSNVTITGQLMMTDLIEKLERHIELIQSNTDGIFFRLRDTGGAGMAACRAIVAAFEQRTKLEMEWTEFEKMYQRDISNYVAKQASGEIKSKGTWYTVKHCTVLPYLFDTRIHSALNDGAALSPRGIDIDRFAIELKRDKNSECFLVDGRPVYDEWLDVVPVRHGSPKRSNIVVVCKEQGPSGKGKVRADAMSLFGETSVDGDLTLRKRRKATGCPPCAALAAQVTVDDIDLEWYAKDKGEIEQPTTEESFLL